MRSSSWLVGVGLLSAAGVLILGEHRVGRPASPVTAVERQAKPTPVGTADPCGSGPSTQDRQAFLELSFSSQAPDASWAENARDEIEAIVQPLTNQDTRLLSVDCRTTLCRVELVHSDVNAFHALAMATLNGGVRGWKGAVSGALLRTEADGSARSVMYLAKQGTEMPVPD